MAYKYNPFSSKLDYYGNVIDEFVTAPSNPYQGQMYANAIDDTVNIWFGNVWQVLHTLVSSSVLLENGNYLLLESGFKIYLD